MREKMKRFVELQRHYYERGVTRPLDFRKEQLQRLYDAIVAHEQEIIDALQTDLGKPAFESYTTEIGYVLSSITTVMKSLDDWAATESVKTPLHLQPAKSYIVHDPYGVVLIIAPFNYPFQLVMEPLIGSIAGGNCTIVKPSEHASATAKVVEEMLEQLFPLQYVRVVQGAKEETDALLRAPFNKVFFTGSERVGKIVMKRCAEQLIPVTLELGGKSPAVVDPTANLEKAAERIVWGKFTNNGQTCVAPDYVLVHESVKEPLMKLLIETIERFYGEYPFESEDYGRIIHEEHFDRLAALLAEVKRDVVHGGFRNRTERFIAPTVIDEPDVTSRVMNEEIFGPLLPIIPYEELPEAVAFIDRHPTPLAAYFFSENERAIRYFETYASFGGGCINDTLAHVGNVHLPFGGVGTSGIGAYHGRASFETFTHAKSMMRKSTKLGSKMAYPPYDGKLSLVRSILK